MARNRKLSEEIKFTTILAATAAVSADNDGTGLDTLLYDSNGFVVQIGTDSALDGSNYWSMELEESDDNSTFTDVADADMYTATGSGSGQFALCDATSEDAAHFTVWYRGTKRYIRVVLNETGTLSGPIAVLGVQSGYKYGPVS